MTVEVPVEELAQLDEQVVKIHTAADICELVEALTGAIRWLGFDDLAITVNKRNPYDSTLTPDICSRPEPFIGIYQKRRLFENDQYLKRCLSSGTPKWATVDVNHPEPFVRELSHFLLSHNIHSAVHVPLPAKKGCSSSMIATASRTDVQRTDILNKLAILARAAMMKLELLRSVPCELADKEERLDLLTAQQIEILKWAGEGKSNSTIAVIMGLSKAGVDYHFRAIISKLGVASRTQAVAIIARQNDAAQRAKNA